MEARCHGLLTVGRRAFGGIPDGGESGVRLQEVGDDLGALHLQLVAAETFEKKRQRLLLQQCMPDAPVLPSPR